MKELSSMSNVEIMKPVQPRENAIVKLQHDLEGLRELVAHLERLRDAARGVNTSDLPAPPTEKLPNGLLELSDAIARELAKAHHLACDLDPVLL